MAPLVVVTAPAHGRVQRGMGKKDGRVAGKKAGKRKGSHGDRLSRSAAFFPPPGTVLTQDRSTPETWCIQCRADRHDLCDRMELRFCDCRAEGHEEEF